MSALLITMIHVTFVTINIPITIRATSPTNIPYSTTSHRTYHVRIHMNFNYAFTIGTIFITYSFGNDDAPKSAPHFPMRHDISAATISARLLRKWEVERDRERDGDDDVAREFRWMRNCQNWKLAAAIHEHYYAREISFVLVRGRAFEWHATVDVECVILCDEWHCLDDVRHSVGGWTFDRNIHRSLSWQTDRHSHSERAITRASRRSDDDDDAAAVTGVCAACRDERIERNLKLIGSPASAPPKGFTLLANGYRVYSEWVVCRQKRSVISDSVEPEQHDNDAIYMNMNNLAKVDLPARWHASDFDRAHANISHIIYQPEIGAAECASVWPPEDLSPAGNSAFLGYDSQSRLNYM